jgi:squalene synthase HpnC
VKSPGLAPPTIEHYENFPVASWLCPPRLRPCIAAIYGFARTADDLADEGDSEASQRLDALERYRIDLNAVAQDARAPTDHPGVFAPLGQAIRAFNLPLSLLHDLLDAFEQDVRMSARGAWYANRAELLDYCRRSANPIGRLLLHLYGVSDARSLAQSDAVCSALQLINFWQDLSVDIPRGRYYLPLDAIESAGVTEAQVMARVPGPALAALLQDQTRWAQTLMLSGAPLPLSLPGRVGWELRLVVQGGLRTLDKVQALGAQAFRTRPRLTALDLLPMVWHSLRMRRQAPAAILPT